MDIKLQLVSQSPIMFNNIKIHQITFQEIEEIGFEKFDQLLLPYIVDINYPDIPEEYKNKYLTTFDYVLDEPLLLTSLVVSLQLFCKTKKILLTEDGISIEDGILNKYNFEEFGNIILQILSRERPKFEKPPVFKNELQRDIWTKIQEGRKRDAKKNELHLYDVLNVCEFYKYHICINEIKNWTLYKIMQCYKVKLGESAWNDNFSIYLVSGEKSLIENKHWIDLIKIDNQIK